MVKTSNWMEMENIKLSLRFIRHHTIKMLLFFRHIDKETGVAPWFKPFDVSWEFNYAGVGRKGSY